MPVTEHLMRPGTFSVGLVPHVPAETLDTILDLIDGAGGHIVVTPSRLQPISGYGDSTILAAALYTGRITARPSKGSIEGAGISSWLGDENGVPIIETAITKTSSTLDTWDGDLVVNGISVGSVTNTGTSYAGTFQYVSYREAWDHLCLAVGAEWEVQPDFTIDAAAPATLFGSTPTVVVTRKPEGPDDTYRGIQGGLLDQNVTAARQVRKVVVVGAGGATGTATNGSLSLKDKAGNSPTLTAVVDSPSEPSGNLSTIATNTLNLSGVRRELNVSSSTPGIRNYVRPGNYVYVYDLDAGIYDTANKIVFRGEHITPLKVRLLSLSWPLERGMGVYLRSNAASPTYTDLSDYVEWEDGDAFWTVGTERVSESTGSPARLGNNPGVVERTQGGWVDYTPTVTQSGTVTKTVNYARYTQVGKSVTVAVYLTMTGAGTTNNAVRVTLPTTAASTNGIMGAGVVYDASTTTRYVVAAQGFDTDEVCFTIDGVSGNVWGISPNLALASGDIISFGLTYEAA